ncbi:MULTISPECIES: flagellar assembly peptidoglycan hydrolase FlgJ [Luteimonas]|uniref:flagellar assembly peptidoglycan hydrolase FlgJ n=1 Tax=Luteimonas TaxID=83614 RepID=UPI000C7D9F6F|nr:MULTISPECIES: flagellar assembly peptidoglycan hydrolase FlgJ [Luteimonas]
MRIAPAPLELAPATRPDATRIDQAAREFEGVFAQMLIKSMRDASFGDALFPGENQLYRDLYDQKLAKSLTEGDGLGLAKSIARQLGGDAGPAPVLDTTLAPAAGASRIGHLLPDSATARTLDLIAGIDTRGSGRAPSDAPDAAMQSPMDGFIEQLMARGQATAETVGRAASSIGTAVGRIPEAVEAASRAAVEHLGARTPEGFVASIWSHAQDAARELGVDARALVAQAALETGWGRRMIQRGDGATAHNLFGIKATGWKGERAAANTHEYTNGVRHSERADFRAYASPAESFADYVQLLKRSPRYREALDAGTDVRHFAGALQRAGYATDPKYADKISAIANGPTMGRALSTISRFANVPADSAPTPPHRFADAVDGAGHARLR